MSDLPKLESRHTSPLEWRGFTVTRGWNDEVARQLVANSTEPEIMENAPRDHAERFRTKEEADNWYEKGERVVYELGKRGALAGVAWFSHEPLEEYGADYTFAIRLYREARGKGLSGDFMRAVHADLEAYGRYEGPTWLETDENNLYAQRIYAKFGYEAVSLVEGRVKMVRPGVARL